MTRQVPALRRLIGVVHQEPTEHSGPTGRSLSSVRAEPSGLVRGLVHDGHVSVGRAQGPTLVEGDRLILLEADRA